MSDFTFNDPILSTRRSGSVLDPYIPISQSIMVQNNKVLLAEIPDSLQHVTVTGESVTWVEIYEGLPTANQFLVDYSLGIVTFHSSRNNLELQFDYYGTGCDYFPVSRIWTDNEGTTVTETLQDIIDTSAKSITFHTTAPISTDGENGDIWFVYQA